MAEQRKCTGEPDKQAAGLMIHLTIGRPLLAGYDEALEWMLSYEREKIEC